MVLCVSFSFAVAISLSPKVHPGHTDVLSTPKNSGEWPHSMKPQEGIKVTAHT